MRYSHGCCTLKDIFSSALYLLALANKLRSVQDADSLQSGRPYLVTLAHSDAQTAPLPNPADCSLYYLPGDTAADASAPTSGPTSRRLRSVAAQDTHMARSLLNADSSPAGEAGRVPAQRLGAQLVFGPVLFSKPGAVTLVLSLPEAESSELQSFGIRVIPVRSFAP